MEDNTMKNYVKALILTAMASCLLAGCSGSSDSASQGDGKESYTIGIGQFAAHGSLDNCREGFLLGLAEEGIVEGENLTVLYENSQADGGIASQIVTNFASQNVDLICGIATPMAQSAYGIGKKQNIPVIYTAVTDPVAAELAGADGTPVGEITGTSDKLPVTQQLEMIRAILPHAKTIGIMFTTSEVNSLSTIEEYKAAASDYGFEIVDTGISTTADVPLAADSLLEKVDCITNLTDNTVVASLPVILDKATKKNIPVFGSEIEQVKIGCLASMGLDYIDLGRQTGKMAAAVLKGEKKASEMKFEIIEEASFYGNTKVAENLGITFPEELTSSAKELFHEITQ
jgi:putative ABC transport system substrate-binding protein